MEDSGIHLLNSIGSCYNELTDTNDWKNLLLNTPTVYESMLTELYSAVNRGINSEKAKTQATKSSKHEQKMKSSKNRQM